MEEEKRKFAGWHWTVWWCIRNAFDAKMELWSQPKFFARGINYLFIYWSFGSNRLFICLRVFWVSGWRCFVFLPPLFRIPRFWWYQISWKKKKQKKNIQIRFRHVRCVCLLRWFHRVYHKSANIMLVRNGALVLFAFFVLFHFFFSPDRPMTRKNNRINEQECAI